MGDAYMQEREPTPEEMAEYVKDQERRRRRAVVCLSHEDIAVMLQAPEGTEIVGAWYEWRTQQLEVALIGDQFDLVADACEAPRIEKEFKFERCNLGDMHIQLDFPGGNDNG